jgi:hypothetical protein
MAKDIATGSVKSAGKYIFSWATSSDQKWDWADFGSEIAQGAIEGSVDGVKDINKPKTMQNRGITFPEPDTASIQIEMTDFSCSPNRLDID